MIALTEYNTWIGKKNHGYIVVAVRDYMDVIDVLAVRGSEWVIGYMAELNDDNTVSWAYGHYSDSFEDLMDDWIVDE